MPITKTGRELIRLAKYLEKYAEDDTENKKAPLESLGVGVTAGILTPLAYYATTIPLRKALRPIAEQNLQGIQLTDAEVGQIAKHLRKKPIKLVDIKSPLGGVYAPSIDTVFAPKNSYIVAHELGHAGGLFGKNKTIGSLLAKFTHRFGGGRVAPIIRGLDSTQKAYNHAKGYSEEDDSTLLDYVSKANQIATAGQLAEEAQATIRGLNAIRKVQGNAGMLRAAKGLLPAYGSYLLHALGAHYLVPRVGTYLGEKLSEYF